MLGAPINRNDKLYNQVQSVYESKTNPATRKGWAGGEVSTSHKFLKQIFLKLWNLLHMQKMNFITNAKINDERFSPSFDFLFPN